jgi:DNA mismatch endonuclease (patch repair protein)
VRNCTSNSSPAELIKDHDCRTAGYVVHYTGLLLTIEMKTIKRFDPLSRKQRSERMSRIRAVDTKPEMRVRRLVWSLGFRYRLHSSKLPGRPDLVFSSRRKVIFIHGCFWHQHPKCRQYRMPKSKLDFWLPKLTRNAERDLNNQKSIRAMGWKYLVVWECELRNPALPRRVVKFLGHHKTS